MENLTRNEASAFTAQARDLSFSLSARATDDSLERDTRMALAMAGHEVGKAFDRLLELMDGLPIAPTDMCLWCQMLVSEHEGFDPDNPGGDQLICPVRERT